MRIRQSILCIFVSLLLLPGLLFAQGRSEQPSENPIVTYVDSMGNEVILTELPDRIVSMSPNVTEALFALDAGDKIVGRSDYCNYPLQATAIDSIGTLWQPSLEKIISLEPDLVIAASIVNDDIIAAVKEAKIPIAVIRLEQDVAGAFKMMEDIGYLIGETEKAIEFVSTMKAQIDSVVKKVSNLPRPTVYYVVSFGDFDSTATGDTYIHEMMELAGATNVAADGLYWSYTKELLVEKDPDILVLSPHIGSDFETTKALMAATPGYSGLVAVKQNSVFPIDGDMVNRQGPRTAQAIEEFARIFHPEVF